MQLTRHATLALSVILLSPFPHHIYQLPNCVMLLYNITNVSPFLSISPPKTLVHTVVLSCLNYYSLILSSLLLHVSIFSPATKTFRSPLMLAGLCNIIPRISSLPFCCSLLLLYKFLDHIAVHILALSYVSHYSNTSLYNGNIVWRHHCIVNIVK